MVEEKEKTAGKVVRKRSSKVVKPSWIKMKSDEMEKIVVELAKKGESPAKIGLILRDKYGIPKVKLFGKRMVEIFAEHGVNYDSGEGLVGRKVDDLKKHISKNKHDYPAKRALTKKLWVQHYLKEAR